MCTQLQVSNNKATSWLKVGHKSSHKYIKRLLQVGNDKITNDSQMSVTSR